MKIFVCSYSPNIIELKNNKFFYTVKELKSTNLEDEPENLEDESYEFSINSQNYPDDSVWVGFFNQREKCIKEFEITDFVNDYLMDFKTVFQLQSTNGWRRVYSVIKDSSSDKLIVLFYSNFNSDGSKDLNVENYPDFNNKRLYDIAGDYCPALKEKYSKTQIRKNLLQKLNPNNMLSYVEAQVDILTKLVLEMIKVNPAIKKSCPSFEKFEESFSETSLFNVKSMEDCLGEISGIKSKVRKLQDEYYKATKKDYESKPPLTLQELRTIKKEKINSIRNSKEQDVFELNGRYYDCDSLSVQRISIAAQNALASKILNVPFEIDWTLADNSVVRLNADDMLEVSQALAIHGATVHSIAKELKEVADEAKTAEDVESIVWPS